MNLLDQSLKPRFASSKKADRPISMSGVSSYFTPNQGNFSVQNSISGETSHSFLKKPVSEYFGELTLTLEQIYSRLNGEEYYDLQRSLEKGKKIQTNTAEAIATVVKDWAMSKGATHYCHWFQPMNGLTAEKHDAFISMQPSRQGIGTAVIERFSGRQLIQGEPDASSLPSGGMRSTFEARGYTCWDHTSPLFIIENAGTRTLCVPSVYFGYHGNALDNKTPLLRSSIALSNHACAFLKLIGDVDVKNIGATLGVEQEYFLLDQDMVRSRPDLMLAKRTLMGVVSSRGQKLADHYFGSIPSRVLKFMDEMEYELYRLGVPVKTRHNEVAPSQYETAPIHENITVASDHNSITMELMKRVASKHGLACLFYEKPFNGVNGSGKHCNYSLCNDKGENLLDPGKTPHQNLRFLAVLVVVTRALQEYSDVFQAFTMSRGNELRLGKSDAPPSMFTCYLGEELEAIIDNLRNNKGNAQFKKDLNIGISNFAALTRDYSDTNRTAPCAFTGDKFEFRTLGSSATVAQPMSILNALIAKSFELATIELKKLIETNKNRDDAVIQLITNLYGQSKPILYSGNSYSEDWIEKAEDSKLFAPTNTLEAISILLDTRKTQFLVDMGVLSQDEIMSRYRVRLEKYIKKIEIEISILNEMAVEFIIPAVEKQLTSSIPVLDRCITDSLKASQKKRVGEIEEILNGLIENSSALRSFIKSPVSKDGVDLKEVVEYINSTSSLVLNLRDFAERAESVVSDEYWQLPKYRELLFSHRMR